MAQYFSPGSSDDTCNFFFRVRIGGNPSVAASGSKPGGLAGSLIISFAIGNDTTGLLAWTGVKGTGDNSAWEVWATNESFGNKQTTTVSGPADAQSDSAAGQVIAATGGGYWIQWKVSVAALKTVNANVFSGQVGVLAGTSNSNTLGVWNRDCVNGISNSCDPTPTTFQALASPNLSAASVPAPDVYLSSNNGSGAVNRGTSWSQSVAVGHAIDTVTVTSNAGGGDVTSYSIDPTSLPNGVSFNTSTGVLSGTPTETWTATSYVLKATGPGGDDTVTFSLTVTSTATAPVIRFDSASGTTTKSETATAGSAITGFTIDSSGGGSVDSYAITISSGAGFSINGNGLTFNTSTGELTGTPSNTQTATTYTITATGSGGTATLTYTLQIDPQQFTVSFTQPATGGTFSLSPSGGTYDSGTAVTATMGTLSSGYTHGSWGGTAGCTGSTSTPCTFTVTSAVTVTGSLTASAPAPSGGGYAPPPPPTSYNLNVTATGQGVVSPAGGVQTANATITLSAAARTGWTFSNWTGDCAGTTPTCSVTMNSDKNVGAVFTEDAVAATAVSRFPISVSVTGAGIVQVSPGQPAGGYPKDSVVRITAVPRTGWSLDTWGGACSGTLEFCMITIDGTKSITATFKASSAPDVVSAAWVQPQANGTSLVSWEAASGATQYLIDMNGKQVCRSTQTTCTIERIVGPRDVVVVKAANTAGTATASEAASYVTASRALQLFSVNFTAGSSTLTAKARTALNKAIKQMKLLGYTELSVIGHTDNREAKAAALSLARAKAVATFVGRELDVTVVTSGKAAMSPLTTNSTITGRAANRRAVGFVR